MDILITILLWALGLFATFLIIVLLIEFPKWCKERSYIETPLQLQKYMEIPKQFKEKDKK